MSIVSGVLTTTFQSNAFQNNAFQIGAGTVFQPGSKGEKYDISLYEEENSFENDAITILLLLN